MQVGQQPFVIHVVRENTMTKQIKRLNQVLVKVVPVVLTALLAHPVVRILQLLVLLEPMPVEQQPFVIYVVLGNIMTKQVKRLVRIVPRENTKTKREKHPATTIV